MGRGEELRAAMGSGGTGLLGTKWPLPLLLLFIMGKWGPPSLNPHSWVPGGIHSLGPRLDPKPAGQSRISFVWCLSSN